MPAFAEAKADCEWTTIITLRKSLLDLKLWEVWRYRDLVFLLTFGVQLAMYATPVIYPLSEVPADYQWLVASNPMTAVIETFKYGFLGQGTFS